MRGEGEGGEEGVRRERRDKREGRENNRRKGGEGEGRECVTQCKSIAQTLYPHQVRRVCKQLVTAEGTLTILTGLTLAVSLVWPLRNAGSSSTSSTS